MGFLGTTVGTSTQSVTSESMGTLTYPLTITGATASNIHPAPNTLPTSAKGAIVASMSHTVNVANRKLTIHAGMPYVYNSRSGMTAPTLEQFGFGLYVDGTCLRVVSEGLVPSTSGASFIQIAAAIAVNTGVHTIELRAFVPTAQSSVTIGGGYAIGCTPFIIIRESS